MNNGASFKIVDLKTNRQWDVEAIQPRRQHRTEFGKSITNHCNGAINESESQINEETHSNIQYVRNPSDHVKGQV